MEKSVRSGKLKEEIERLVKKICAGKDLGEFFQE